MAKFQLLPGETLIGEGHMTYRHEYLNYTGKSDSLAPNIHRTTESTRVYVTDRRVVCTHFPAGMEYFQWPLEELRGYQRGSVLKVPADIDAIVPPMSSAEKARRLPGRIAFYLLAILSLLVVFALPTSWVYDLGLKAGTEQGQRPGASVQTLQTAGDIFTFIQAGQPATVSPEGLIPCPLARLRDESLSKAKQRYRTSSRSSRKFQGFDNYRTLPQDPSLLQQRLLPEASGGRDLHLRLSGRLRLPVRGAGGAVHRPAALRGRPGGGPDALRHGGGGVRRGYHVYFRHVPPRKGEPVCRYRNAGRNLVCGSLHRRLDPCLNHR